MTTHFLPDRLRVFCVAALALMLIAGCGDWTDAATRIAYDLKAGAASLGAEEGAVYVVRHAPARAGECTGPFKVQFDQVGALVIWCQDAAGNTISSHSTSYHSNYVDTAQTSILDRPAGAELSIHLERRHGRAVIVEVS